MHPNIPASLRVIARHSKLGVMTTLLTFCRIKGAKGEMTEADAAEIYDIVRAEYDSVRKREPRASDLDLTRERAIKAIRRAINSGSEG